MDASSTETNTGYWQDFSFHNKINKLIIDGHLADCKFIVGPEDETAETIYGHKIFFIVESPVFETMFSGNYVEAQGKSEIRLNDVTPEDFKNLSYMIYTKSPSNFISSLILNEILTLYRLCDKYMMTSISQICINHMNNSTFLETICVDDLITVFEFARDLKDKTLLQSTRQIIQKRCKSVTKRSDTLTEEAFYDYVRILSESTSEGSTRISEKELHIFSVVNSYFVNNNLLEILNSDKQADHNDESKENSQKFDATTINRIKIFHQNLLKLIAFENMEVADFQNGASKSEIITFEQKYSILSDLIKKCCCNRTKEQCKLVYSNGKYWKICAEKKI